MGPSILKGLIKYNSIDKAGVCMEMLKYIKTGVDWLSVNVSPGMRQLNRAYKGGEISEGESIGLFYSHGRSHLTGIKGRVAVKETETGIPWVEVYGMHDHKMGYGFSF
jgi:hypothetical protein